MRSKIRDFSEAELYGPVKAHFEKLGYLVRGEVKGCDIALVKDGEAAVVELKRAFNISLLYQAVDRKKFVPQVYVAVPRHAFTKNRSQIKDILKQLNIGLITVSLDSPVKTVDVHLVPTAGKRSSARTKALVAEVQGRTFDGNVGGRTKQKLLTVHRERCYHIACVLEKVGEASGAVLAKRHGCYKKAGFVMRRNVYGWFVRVSKGVYALSDEGRAALEDPNFQEIVGYYRKCITVDQQELST